MKSSCFVGAVILVLMELGAVAQVPLVNQGLIPASVVPGSQAFTLTVNGTGFSSGAVVNWNGSPRLTEVFSSSQLKATINASDVAAAQTGWITVTNPSPLGGTSNVVFLPVRRPTASIGMAISQPFPGATFVAAGDFNNDGKLDVGWYVNNGGFKVSLGNGKGGFQAPILNSNVFGDAFVVGDFNNDGKLDVAAANHSQVLLWVGNGDGTFTEAWDFYPAFSGDYITAADFFQSGQISFYHMGWSLGQQWFEFVWEGNSAPYYTGYFPGPAVVGDFNGDGWLDLAISEFNAPTTHIWLYSNGSYTEVGTTYAWGIAADMNRDGKLDLNNGCISLGGGNGTFTLAGCPKPSGPPVGIGDFDGDGNLDTVEDLSDPSTGAAAVALGKGDGTYGHVFQFPLPPLGFGVQLGLGAVSDFNNDGKLDFVTQNGYLFIQTTVNLTPFSLAFGSENVGTTSAAQIATLTNVGTSALTINQIVIAGANASSFAQTNNCGTSLAAGASCTISVTFTPKKAGPLAGTLAVSYKGTASPQTVGLSGTGLTPPTVSLLPAGLKFATQLVGTTSAAQTATLTNTGSQPVTISSIAVSGAFSDTNNCPSILDISGSCHIQVTFQPTAAGTATGTLSVTDNAANSPQKVALGGTGTVITISPVAVNFGNQTVGTVSALAQITLTNSGTSAVSIGTISLTGTNPGDFEGENNCGKSVAAHGSCIIKVAFKPTATGARSASVSVTDNGGGSPQTVALTGIGT